MSEDIDFKEIDDLMAAMDGDAKVEKAIAAEASVDKPVVKKKVSKPKARPAAKAKPTPKTDGEIVSVKIHSKPAPKPEAEPEIEYKPNPKTGHYMDLVHPMSDMTADERPDRKAPPVVIVKTVAAGAINLVSPEATSEIDDEVVEDVLIDELPESEADDDDILAGIIDEVDVVVEEETTNEPDELDRLADELSYDDLETPFLEHVKVEKRPLGGGEPTEREIKLSELAKAEENRPVNRAREEAADQEFVSDKDHIEWASGTKKSSEKPAKPAKPAKQKSHGAVNALLYILLIVLLIILGGAIGVLAYFSGLLEGLI
ncbi:hypothetical protein FACS189431_5600 [Alphaproteobacteria bacterium]|nr:hypothetical protein FACS189431_5600 [Alphaproteobacteria bacterium]